MTVGWMGTVGSIGSKNLRSAGAVAIAAALIAAAGAVVAKAPAAKAKAVAPAADDATDDFMRLPGDPPPGRLKIIDAFRVDEPLTAQRIAAAKQTAKAPVMRSPAASGKLPAGEMSDEMSIDMPPAN